MADRMLPDALSLLSCLLLIARPRQIRRAVSGVYLRLFRMLLLCIVVGLAIWLAEPALAAPALQAPPPTPTPVSAAERSMVGPIIGLILVALASTLAVFGSLAISRHMRRIAGIRDDER